MGMVSFACLLMCGRQNHLYILGKSCLGIDLSNHTWRQMYISSCYNVIPAGLHIFQCNVSEISDMQTKPMTTPDYVVTRQKQANLPQGGQSKLVLEIRRQSLFLLRVHWFTIWKQHLVQNVFKPSPSFCLFTSLNIALITWLFKITQGRLFLFEIKWNGMKKQHYYMDKM